MECVTRGLQRKACWNALLVWHEGAQAPDVHVSCVTCQMHMCLPGWLAHDSDPEMGAWGLPQLQCSIRDSINNITCGELALKVSR